MYAVSPSTRDVAVMDWSRTLPVYDAKCSHQYAAVNRFCVRSSNPVSFMLAGTAVHSLRRLPVASDDARAPACILARLLQHDMPGCGC